MSNGPLGLRPRLLVGCATLVLCAHAVRAQDAETPDIVVTAPSPILPTDQGGAGGEVPAGILPVIENVFAPVTVVPRSEIVREQPKTLGDALFDKPGVSASTYAPGAASRPIIRGLDNFRVRVQENGVGVQDVSELGEDHAVPINPLVNNRIEVIRGPATLRFGSQAIGGVVSAESNRVPSFIPPNGISGQILGGVSSVDSGRNGAVTVDAGGGNVAFHADAFRTAAASYMTPWGTQLNSANQSQGGAVGMSYVFDRGFIGLSLSHYDSLYQIPGGEAVTNRTRLDPTQDKVISKGEYRPESGPFEAIRFWAGTSHYKHHELGLDDNGIDGVRTSFQNKEVEGRIEAQHLPVTTQLGTLTGAVGVQADNRYLRTWGDPDILLAPARTRALATYVFEQLAITDDFKLQAAGRAERDVTRGNATQFPADFLPVEDEDPQQRDRRREFAPKSASFGGLYKIGAGITASLTGSYVERAPAAPELFSRGAHDATATFEIGNPDLKKERARTIEFGLRRSEGPFRFEATAYYTRYTGFIYKRLTGVLCGDTFASCGQEDETELKQIVYTQRDARFRGVEVATQLDIVPIGTGFIGVDSQFDTVHAKFDDGTYVPRLPPYRAGAGVFWRDTEAGWFARLNFLHAFPQYRIAPNETPTPGYNLLRAEISYTHKFNRDLSGISEITVGLRGDNLLNDEMRNSASFKKDEILLPGRNGRLFVVARF